MTTNAGLEGLGLTPGQMELFWNFLTVVKALRDKAGLPGTTTWTANNIINFMEGLPQFLMTSFDEDAGIRGLKQIYKSLEAIEPDDLKRDAVFERHTAHYLNRCFPDWMT